MIICGSCVYVSSCGNSVIVVGIMTVVMLKIVEVVMALMIAIVIVIIHL